MSGETYTPWDSAEFLDDDEARIEYLKAALAENDPEFFAKAVGNVARAMGMTTVARGAQMGRPSLYKSLSGERDPRLGTVMRVLDALGIRLTVATGAVLTANSGAPHGDGCAVFAAAPPGRSSPPRSFLRACRR